ncbi:MAG: cupredoxin family copper-binding protein [Acidobacteria bacterium]|nr:cupredoxin family copper-binding protein [Acidobacteriota bacterium]
MSPVHANAAALVTVAALAAAAIGCAARPADEAPAARAVTIEAVAFSPADVRVKTGDRITWTNRDPFAHTVTTVGDGFDSGSIGAGQSWTFRASRAGAFPYVCSLHPVMTGTVIVE